VKPPSSSTAVVTELQALREKIVGITDSIWRETRAAEEAAARRPRVLRGTSRPWARLRDAVWLHGWTARH
jgi:hypothetical protein